MRPAGALRPRRAGANTALEKLHEVREKADFSAFRQQMTEAASTIQGSGWALTSWEPTARRLVVQQVHDHQGNHGQGMIPLLAIDAWEHAFYLQYENRKTEYLDAVWNVINWADVSDRLDRARW